MSPKVYHALLVAEAAHRGQMRKVLPVPYIVHPIRVAQAAERAGLSDDVQAAGLLHDVPEDTAVGLDALAADLLISGRTCRLVRLLTKWWEDQATPATKHEHKPVYYGNICKDDEAVLLKILDRIDNLDDMVRLCEHPAITKSQFKWAQRYAEKTAAEFVPLRLIAARCHPAIAADYETALVRAVEAGEARRRQTFSV